jgi:hypothetical protein
MLDLLKNSLKKINESNEFKRYKKENSDAYLTSTFIMLDENNKGEWQVDFYSPKKHKITSFVINKTIKVNPSEKIFQKEVKKIEPLDLENIKITLDDAFKKIDSILQKKFPYERPSKKIIIMQMFNNKEILNISYITTTFNLINTKIDAVTGKVIESKLHPLIDLRKK